MDYLDGLRSDVNFLATMGAEGDSLARLAHSVLDNWRQHPASFAAELPETGGLLKELPTLRVALCMTALKRDDQVKQILPVLCMFMARIRSARSSAYLKPASRPPSKQTSRQDAGPSLNQHRTQQQSREPESQSDSCRANQRTAGKRVGRPADLSASRPVSG